MLINPSNLYSGGNVKFDSSPYLRMAMQQRAKRQALDEASAQYFNKLPEKLNTAGVRDVDMQDPNGNGGIQNDIDKWTGNWAMNKGSILRGGLAQQQHMADFERIRQKIQASKDRAKTELEIGKEALKPNGWKPREEDHPVIDALSKSIYDRSSKKSDGVSEYGLNDLSLSAAPFTSQLELQHNKSIENGVVPDKIPEDKGTFDPVTKKVTYNYGYTPEKVTQLAQNAIKDVTSNRTLKYHYEDMLHDPQLVEVASKALQHDYDSKHTDGLKVIADTPEEMAAGLTIAKYKDAKIPKTFTDQKSIDEYKSAEWNRRNAITNAQRVRAAALHSSRADARLNKMMQGQEVSGYPLDDVVKDLAVDAPIQDADGKSMGTQKRVYKKDIPVGEFEIYNTKESPVHGYKEYKVDDKTGKSEQIGDEYFLPTTDANGHKQLVGEGGKIIGAEVARQNFINKAIPTNKTKQGIYFNKTGAKKFNVINPKTGAVVMEGVDEETAKKATAKGYKTQ